MQAFKAVEMYKELRRNDFISRNSLGQHEEVKSQSSVEQKVPCGTTIRDAV
jgi:hypothetical protein